MIMDKQLEFSLKQAITSTADSTNIVDLSDARTLGVGDDLYIVSVVTTATLNDSSGTDATITVTLNHDTVEGFGSDTVAQTLYTFAHGNPVGTLRYAKINPVDLNRYIGLVYTVASGPFNAGALTSFICNDIQAARNYASGFSIS